MAHILFSVLRVVRRPTNGALLVVAVALGACADASERPRPMQVRAQVVAASLDLAVDNIPPGREITALVLVDPQGGETPARNREFFTREEASGGNAGPGVAVGATGGSSSGISPYLSLGYLFRGDDRVQRSRRLTAEIPLPAPSAYAAGYRDWRIEVRYRDHLGEQQRLSIPAPAP